MKKINTFVLVDSKAKRIMKENGISIQSIIVEKLFGHYTYTLPKKPDEKTLNKLFILYGDNGSGKTTILNLIFYLLSTKDKSGYKSKLAQTKFKKFAIVFSNGNEIGALRENEQYGSFTYYIKKNNRYVHTLLLQTSGDHSIRIKDGTDDSIKFIKILTYIKNLNISIFYLSDNRKTLNSQLSSNYEDDINTDYLSINMLKLHKYELMKNDLNLSGKILSLDSTIEMFIDWIRKQVIQSSKIGETDTLNIYSDLIKSMNTPPEKLPPITKLMSEFKLLEKQSIKLSKFGLIAPADFFELNNSISSIKREKQESLLEILQLFINSTKARFDALQSLYEVINDFIQAINLFYTNKKFSFNLLTGFTIKHQEGGDLTPDMLSSGEKQLLLLFINTITASEQATIFIIDEPEISLNIKWQRMLLKTLLKFSSKNYVQFIIATHSIELLAPNTQNVVKLEA